MRRLLVAALLVVTVLALAGCSSGSSNTAAPTTPPPTASAAAPVAAGAPGVLPELADRSVNETATFVPFPTTSGIPDALKKTINVDKQPTLIYFFDSSQSTSAEVRQIIDRVLARNRGMVDLVAYDVGKYASANPDGSIALNDALASDPAGKQTVHLARDPAINVAFTPFIVMTDGQGYIIYKHSGLVDSAYLEREIQRAAR